MGITSIVILSYNTYALTRQCIESIRLHTESKSYELIVVDNGSNDGSVEYLKKQSDVRGIYNTENVGFPKGCNQGMAIACGTEILLLNSDTVVTPRWLSQLKHALYSNDDVGAVSCVTNYCSNKQQLQTVPYDVRTLTGLMEFAEEYNHSNHKLWMERTKLVGFCLCIKKSVVDEIGMLDEVFTPGNYEDDDYSLRILKAGYRLILCADTFVHHYGSASFLKSIGVEEREKRARKYNELLKRNHCIFYNKWDVPMDVWAVMEPQQLLNYQKMKHPTDQWKLDENKICFICRVDDVEKYNESLNYWRRLKVPEGMKLESLVIQAEESIAEAYETAMSQSDAKYKIYIYQNVWIMQLDFLETMINVFRSDNHIGIMGVIGSKKKHSSVVRLEDELLGAICDDHTGEMKSYIYKRSVNEYLDAAALGGFLLMTQYDVPWHTDITNEEQFFDVSQCIEFSQRGYKVAIMPQKKPGIVYWCGRC